MFVKLKCAYDDLHQTIFLRKLLDKPFVKCRLSLLTLLLDELEKRVPKYFKMSFNIFFLYFKWFLQPCIFSINLVDYLINSFLYSSYKFIFTN